ncbi:MAG: FAD-dependent oxidoreductase [Chloroflexi bacterium]|nr:FAD-dependent oxidoreductase [Chloroflexota bacterium]
MSIPDESFVKELLDRHPGWFNQEEQMQYARLTRNLYPYTELFSPIQVNRLTLKNRLVMGPMGNISMAEEMGRPANKMIQYFTERARGGVGLITSGLIPISQNIDPTVTEVGDRSYFPRIDRSRTVFAGWRDLAENVHAYGARFFIQLTPGLGRVGSPETLLKKYKLPVSASWNPNFYLPGVPCRPLTDGECWRIIHAGGQAAADAKAAVIDGVYLHGHEGYLLEQMTNPAFNRRALGRFADWQAFGIQLVKDIRERVGANYPIMYRIDLSLALNATYGPLMDEVGMLKKFKKERTIAMTLDYMANLVKAGVDLFDVDLGCYDNWWLPHPPNSMPSGCFLPVARLVKDYFAEKGITSNAGLPVPVVAVGKLGYPDLAEKALRDGDCDMIMLARPLLADPQWPNKAYAGRVDEIRPCIGDQEACINEFVEGGHPQCAVNPRTGFEDVYPDGLPPVAQSKKVAVIGAGPAGVMAAVVAAQRGHSVTLFEARSCIGGQLVPGSVPKIKYEVANYLEYLERLLQRAEHGHGLVLKLNTRVDVEAIRQGQFEMVVVSAGGNPVTPRLPGVDGDNVIQAIDLLRQPDLAARASRVVIIGGGAVGCETAHFLSTELGKSDVTIVEMLPALMVGACTANRGHLLHELRRLGVKVLNCTRLNAVQPEGAVVTHNTSASVPSPWVTWTPLLPENVKNPLARPIRDELVEETLPADLVVLALGLRPNQDLYHSLVAANAAPEIRLMGDGFQIGRVFEAVKSGYLVGRSL